MSLNCDFIAIFSIYGQFRAILKLQSSYLVFKTSIFPSPPTNTHQNGPLKIPPRLGLTTIHALHTVSKNYLSS